LIDLDYLGLVNQSGIALEQLSNMKSNFFQNSTRITMMLDMCPFAIHHYALPRSAIEKKKKKLCITQLTIGLPGCSKMDFTGLKDHEEWIY
jgi:hypothetical protein